MYSVREDWDSKIADELRRIRGFGWQPEDVIAVTNRSLDRVKEQVLQDKAAANGWALTIYGQEWLATRLHLRDNIDLRSEYLGLARPEPDLFMLAPDFRALLDQRGLLPTGFVAREQELQAALGRLGTDTANFVLEGDGGLGKTRLVYEMSQRDRRERRWFFVPEGLPFHPSRLSELESGDEVVVVIDDAHRRPDLRALLAGLERRVPRPQLVLIARPGYDDVIERARRGLVFDEPVKMRIARLGRKDIVTLLRQPPLELKREGVLLAIVQLSGGNPQIAIIAGKFAASGKAPHDLHSGNVFRGYVDSVLDAAPAAAPEGRELLALIAAVRTIDLASARDVAVVCGITGLDGTDLRRRLEALADAALVAELASSVFTIEPDLLSDEILRYSFFDEKRRPTLRYATVYDAFAPHRRLGLLQALSEARVGSSPAAKEALRVAGGDLLAGIGAAPSGSLSDYARFAAAATGIPDISLDLADALIARLPEIPDSEFGFITSELVGAASRAKFGDFARGFRTLLRLGRILFACSGAETAAQEALCKDITEVYSCCPVDYSDDDWRVLAGVQTAICDETEQLWPPGEVSGGSVVIAAITARALLTLIYEHLRPAADDAMSLRIYNVGVPATPQTRRALKLGARLFSETFLRLPARLQLKQLESLREIANAAAGVSGLCDYRHPADVQALAQELLGGEIEPWLRQNLAVMSLPVAAEVVSYFQCHPRPGRRVRLAVGTRLREYIDLVHPGVRGAQRRWSWEAEQETARRHAEKYAKRLLAAKDPLNMIDRWNAWLEEARLALNKSPWHQALPLTLAEVAKRDPSRARTITEHIYENNLCIGAYGTLLLEAIATVPAGHDLIDCWLGRPEPHLRSAAATAAAALDKEESRPALTRLARDEDPSVRAAVWDALYRRPGALSGWQLDTALELSGKPPADHRLEFLLPRLAMRSGGEEVILTGSQKAAVAELVLATARTQRLPHHGTSILLECASKLGLDLVQEWLWGRVDHLRHAGRGVYPDDLPADLGPMVKSRRQTQRAKDTLARLFRLYEEDDLPWCARQAAEQAISWLADDTPELTAQIVKWSRQAEGVPRAMTFLARTREWDLYTERARLLLRAHPHDRYLKATIIGARRPMSFWGSGESQYRAEAEQFARWLEADDPLLLALGREAVTSYNELAAEAAAEDERDHQALR